jgi:hypothetical protein
MAGVGGNMSTLLSKENLGRLRSLVGAVLALVPSIAVAQGASAPLAVWAIGLPDGYIIMEHQENVIHVTAADVARGVVEVRGGSRFVVTAHSASRYSLKLANRGTLFSAVHIEGLDSAAALGPASAVVADQDAVAGRRVISVDYRFTLAPGTAPGTYAWPLELVARGEQAAR